LPPEGKVVAAVATAVAVVATPPTAVWAFAVQAALLLVVARTARVPLRTWLRRLTVELPFLLFALALPVLGTGPRVAVGPLSLSESGLLAAWALLVKGTLGVATSALLVATTTPSDLVRALERLRLPRVLVSIANFLLRYLEVLAADLARMRIARASRGDDPRWLWQVGGIARTAGALFVRSFERGERVLVAMLSRGYGEPVERERCAPGWWWPALALPLAAGVVAAVALLLR
jgi:cobalt/nickel transport system permease protein